MCPWADVRRRLACQHSRTHSQQSFFPRMDVKTLAACIRQILFTFLRFSSRIKSSMIAQPRAYSLWKDMCSNRQIRLSFLMMLSRRWGSHCERVLKYSLRVLPVMNGDRPLYFVLPGNRSDICFVLRAGRDRYLEKDHNWYAVLYGVILYLCIFQV